MANKYKNAPKKGADKRGAKTGNDRRDARKSNNRSVNRTVKEKKVKIKNEPVVAAENQPQIGTIQWFPGHMARTRRKIQESLSLIDAVVEIVDARIPLASRNPEMDTLTRGKPRLVILNKADLADDVATKRWLTYFRRQGMAALAVDCKTGRGCQQFHDSLRELLRDLVEKWESKGAYRAIRAMIVGIPNVGKSSFINRMNRGGKAKVEDRPGVTRMNQWFVIEGGTQLLDTPGVLWPKFEDQAVAMRLAFTGAIKDQVLYMEEMACELLGILRRDYPSVLIERYKLTEPLNEDNWELLHDIGRKRGMLVSGGEIDTERASIMLLDEYRGGKLGRITLEWPPEERGEG